jgi:hypothetical protein
VTIETVRTLLDIADRLEYALLSTSRTSASAARVVTGLRSLIDDELDKLADEDDEDAA